QDHAGVGVALPDALQTFRLERLKAFGVNAIRCAHNPATPEFLDACDRLGLLVIDENRLMGTNPTQLDELASMMRRDRNHPSVILWSLGNEEWAIEGNIKGARIAADMQAFARRLDPSRETTVAISGGWGGISTVIDVVGYNYIHQSNPDEQHAKFPHQSGVGTEESTTQGTRGVYFDDREHVHLSPQAHGDSGGNCEIGWKYYAARPFLAGLFYWTGLDYRGEPTPFGWPAISSQFGLLDTCGFPKDSAYYLKAWWTNEHMLHLYPHWNWPGHEGQPITVGCDSNDDAVELFLNNVSLGRQEMPRNGHLEWKVSYAPGTLEARGYRDGRVVDTARIETTGAPTELVLTPDRTTIAADGADVAVFTVSAKDAAGRTVPTASNLVHFEVTGGRIIGVGNGDPGSHEADQFNETVSLSELERWRGRIAPANTVEPSDTAELRPLYEIGNWKAPLPKPGEVYDLAVTFTVAPDALQAKRALFLPSFGTRTSVWLNGRQVARDVDSIQNGPEIAIDAAGLVSGANEVRLIVTPFADGRNHIPETDRLGTVRVTVPAPPAQRSLFNGYAQVLVQSNPTAGEIRLSASASGLRPATSTIEAR
ncbi:MAG TPA: glycoside hydrolase family 2 TIM barrel-domain containing protein, partial [Opitutaceae bacterium]|nr:glycoside hydrolase family 2 TIM barrel-domain containing protein [Opitutaceae bacterium]